MTKKLLDISNNIDAGSVVLYQSIAEVAETLAIDYLVVGASGRDLVLHHGYGVDVQRATGDYDFAFEVSNLSAYEALRIALTEEGYRTGDQPQRLISPYNLLIDLVPFGDLADESGNVTLPPNHDHEMSVLGFREARENAQIVRMRQEPVLDVPVVSLAGLVLLKLIAWGDRSADRRAKDAQDIRYVFESFLKIPHEVTDIWSETEYLELFNGDIEQVAAAILGRETKAIASNPAADVIEELLTGNRLDAFILDMDARYAASPSGSPRLIEAFSVGFFER